MSSDSINPAKISLENTFNSILSNEQLREFLQTAPLAIYEIDYNGPCFRTVNDMMCKLSGYIREELLLTNPFNLLTPEGRELFKERIRRVSSGEKINIKHHIYLATIFNNYLKLNRILSLYLKGKSVLAPLSLGMMLLNARKMKKR